MRRAGVGIAIADPLKTPKRLTRVHIVTRHRSGIDAHDLALAEIGESDGLDNVHFEDQIENGKVSFDYHLRPGVVQRSNALALMRAVGLEV